MYDPNPAIKASFENFQPMDKPYIKIEEQIKKLRNAIEMRRDFLQEEHAKFDSKSASLLEFQDLGMLMAYNNVLRWLDVYTTD